MSRASIKLVFSSLACITAIAGCTLIAEVDRSKIDDDDGTGGSTATGGTDGGGAGGEEMGGSTATGGEAAGGEGGEKKASRSARGFFLGLADLFIPYAER